MVIVSIYNAGLGAIQALNFPEVDQILNEDKFNKSESSSGNDKEENKLKKT